jgi:peptidoglycan hydrolase-like amidase
MQKNNFSTLFAVVMILLLIPFVPAFLEGRFDENEYFNDISIITPAFAATQKTQVTNFISAGYIGQYGPSKMPVTPELNPQVLGITAQRSGSSPPLYQAEEVSRSNYIINLNPDQAFTVWVDFLNTGQATWYNHGDHYIALNATDPAGRHSSFQHEFWKEYYRPCRLLQNEVRPGETGRFRFALQAPETKGIYQEKFHLVAEDLIWIDGGYVSFSIGVGQKAGRPYDYQAEEVKRSKGGTIEVDPGQAFTFEVDFKNSGLKNWHNDDGHFIALNVTAPTGRVSLFKHDFWNEYYYRPARLLQSRIYPGETGKFRFALRPPNVEGYYTEKFALVAENLTWLPGGEFTLNFKVGNPPPPAEPTDYSIEDEPTIRIGLYNSTDPVEVTANGAYSIINVNTENTTNKLADETTTINFSADAYWQLVPSNNETIIEITSLNNAPLWNPELNDNTYRGTIEIRYSEEAEEMWIINVLPLESYLKGLAEVANGQPEEYLKALITAARSYVLWHELHGGKHPDKFFDINATTDQVYRGYGFEQRSEDPLLAVQATPGMVITHPDAVSEINPQGIAIAAYFSGTNGRTRNWSEVWAGSGFPWLVSVDDPYGAISNWNTLEANHMVGMSAQGARGYATEENKEYDWILQHYYTGVEVEKIY